MIMHQDLPEPNFQCRETSHTLLPAAVVTSRPRGKVKPPRRDSYTDQSPQNVHSVPLEIITAQISRTALI